MPAWVYLSLGGLLGFVAGWIAALVLRRRSESENRLRSMRRELDQLQGALAQHFAQSAALITRLRSDVEQLYLHLERGASELTTEEAVQHRLRSLEPHDSHSDGRV